MHHLRERYYGTTKWQKLMFVIAFILFVLSAQADLICDPLNDCKSENMKTFIVTGASAGIGKEIARNIGKQGKPWVYFFWWKGHKVILAVRNEEKGKQAVNEFGKFSTNF